MPTNFNRIKEICEDATGKLLTADPDAIPAIVRNATDEAFNGTDVRTAMHHTERIRSLAHYVLAPNHPAVKPEHMLNIPGLSEKWSVPTWAFFVRQSLERIGFDHRYLAPHSHPKFNDILQSIGIYGCREEGHDMVTDMNNWIRSWIQQSDAFATIISIEDHSHGSGNIGTPLRRGALHLAASHDIPMVPARIDGFDEEGEITDVSITFGTPIYTRGRVTKGLLENICKHSYQTELGLTPVPRR